MHPGGDQPGRHPGQHRLDDLPGRLHLHHPSAGGLHQRNPADYEEDHLISLELGGAPRDQRNLWPEPGHSPNAKDTVENVLHSRVCAGTLALAEAQRIATDWTTATRYPAAPQPAATRDRHPPKPGG